eukprot:scaffold293294_cov21-Tisochrysis_lutea.AAC.1
MTEQPSTEQFMGPCPLSTPSAVHCCCLAPPAHQRLLLLWEPGQWAALDEESGWCLRRAVDGAFMLDKGSGWCIMRTVDGD